MFGFEYNLLDDAPYVHSAHHDLVISNQTRLHFSKDCHSLLNRKYHQTYPSHQMIKGKIPVKQARKLQATLVRNYESLTDGGEV